MLALRNYPGPGKTVLPVQLIKKQTMVCSNCGQFYRFNRQTGSLPALAWGAVASFFLIALTLFLIFYTEPPTILLVAFITMSYLSLSFFFWKYFTNSTFSPIAGHSMKLPIQERDEKDKVHSEESIIELTEPIKKAIQQDSMMPPEEEEDVVDISSIEPIPQKVREEIPEKPRKQEEPKKEEIKDLATGYGACFATNRITRDGKKVGYMYKEEPNFPNDSGWRFFSGDETLDYLSDKGNTKIFDVNTIANFDQEIISFLDSGENSVFERDSTSGRLKKVNE